MNKKSQMMKWVVSLVLMLVVIVVVIVIPKNIGEAAEKASARAACKESLRITENLRVLAGSLADKLGGIKQINCVTEYLKTGKKDEPLTIEFANHIVDCWDLYGDRRNLFDQTTGTYCLICKVINTTRANSFTFKLIDYMETNSPTGTKNLILVKWVENKI